MRNPSRRRGDSEGLPRGMWRLILFLEPTISPKYRFNNGTNRGVEKLAPNCGVYNYLCISHFCIYPLFGRLGKLINIPRELFENMLQNYGVHSQSQFVRLFQTHLSMFMICAKLCFSGANFLSLMELQ